MSDFWDELIKHADLSSSPSSASVDNFLSGRSMEADFNDVRSLTDKFRHAHALQLPVAEGTKVKFAGNLGAVLGYENPPKVGQTGVVVTVKSASGLITAHEGKVFVKWDDGVFRPTHAEHLRLANSSPTASMRRMRVASLGDLTEFLKMSSDTLVHKATRDLWSFRQDGQGYVLERLFDTTGDPLKA